MKKLMIALLVAGAAMYSAQASKSYWGFYSEAIDPEPCADAANLTGYNAYLILASDWNSSDVLGSLDKAASSVSYANWDTKVYDVGADDVEYGVDRVARTLSGTFTDGQNYQYQLVLSDGANSYVDLGTYTATALADDSTAKATDAGVTSIMVTSFAGESYISKSMVQSVPEPTSGLLLLLGVAGLALKRKRA